jgi:hypothetical protein
MPTTRRRLTKFVREVRQVYSDGEYLLYLVPRRPWRDHMEFDRAICEAGLKDFLRPVMASDYPNPARRRPPCLAGVPFPEIPARINTLRIREIAAGVRAREFLTVVFPNAEAN